ncbi:DNA-methyltransferase [Olivibacter jilunii]|uniref:DNA-methyltransferase n=1 Tax=Olivibacter jilunii TaxID=985016 RepID=UPI0010321712|nr:site-specific DNA-methyltransferase [Olivibacter jilunii]
MAIIENRKIQLYRDDAISFLKKLPDGSIDIIISDPAYSGMNQRLKIGSGKIVGKYTKGENNGRWFMEFGDSEENYEQFLAECYRVLRSNRHIYLMFDSYSLITLAPVVRRVFEIKNLICWDKVRIGLGYYFRRRHEFVIMASKGKRAISLRGIPDVWRINRVNSYRYPTQKPTEVFQLMLKASAERGFMVCDPFFGSGSSAIAAIKENCRFVGSDISETAIKFATERVNQFLKYGVDVFQKDSLLGDDEMLRKIFREGLV